MKTFYIQVVKSLLDRILAFLGLILFSPILLFVILLLSITNKGKPFFFQLRPGKNQKPFKIIKFKTMTDAVDAHGNLLPDEQRMTLIGNLVRKSSLDEIPQLINVFKGDMSLVGPRPLLMDYLPLYNIKQARRHEVKPGITGWAQVNGRNTISWQQKFEYDLWYVENLSFFLDLRIVLLTIRKVLISEGITPNEQAFTEKFKGN